MLNVISSAFDSALESSNQSVKQLIDSIKKDAFSKVENVEKMTMQLYAGMDLNKVKAAHPDFDAHVPDIRAAMEKHPSLSYEDAYLLAKSKKAGSVQPNDHIETEKPTGSISAPGSRRASSDIQSDDPYAVMAARGKSHRSENGFGANRGVQHFRDFIGDALDRVVSD